MYGIGWDTAAWIGRRGPSLTLRVRFSYAQYYFEMAAPAACFKYGSIIDRYQLVGTRCGTRMTLNVFECGIASLSKKRLDTNIPTHTQSSDHDLANHAKQLPS